MVPNLVLVDDHVTRTRHRVTTPCRRFWHSPIMTFFAQTQPAGVSTRDSFSSGIDQQMPVIHTAAVSTQRWSLKLSRLLCAWLKALNKQSVPFWTLSTCRIRPSPQNFLAFTAHNTDLLRMLLRHAPRDTHHHHVYVPPSQLHAVQLPLLQRNLNILFVGLASRQHSTCSCCTRASCATVQWTEACTYQCDDSTCTVPCSRHPQLSHKVVTQGQQASSERQHQHQQKVRNGCGSSNNAQLQ